MKINKIFHTCLLFSLLMGSIGVKKTHALGTPQIVSINPSSPAQVGACIAIRARVDWDSEYRSMRIRFGNEGWQESSEVEFERNFCTSNYSPGWYTIRVEVAGQGDNSWSNPRVTETQFELTGQPEPSKGPSISQFNFNPSGGVNVGDSVNIHIKVDSNNPGATTLTADCGGLSKNETSEVEFDSNWNTNGCPAQAVNILACSRAVDDPNWTNATCSTRSYTLSSPPASIPVPTAQLWVDNNQVSKGQCTYLHWQTSNADRVDIDGNAVQNSGDQQVCPTVTKKYSLSATNPSGTANRNLTVIVTDNQQPPNVADYFQTRDIIQIGYDIYVIINGERRLVPNPETLDALGITRSWIDNKGFGDSDLKTIPLGQDIPDVNRDPSGFAAFKNRYFSNTTPIVPGTEPTAPPVPSQPQEPNSSSNGQWQVGTRVGLCAGAQIRSGSGFSYPTHTIVPESNWQVEIIGDPRNSDGVTWWNISRANIDGGGTGWVYFEQAGLCNGGSVLGDSTQNGNEENSNQSEQQGQLEVPQPEAQQPESNDCGWLVGCVQAAEEPNQPKICKSMESCGLFDLACHWRNFLTLLDNQGCTNTPTLPTAIPIPLESQTNNDEFSESDFNAWLENYNDNNGIPITLGSHVDGGECKALANAIVAKIPSYGIGNGAIQYIQNNPQTPVLKDVINNVDKCDVILFTGSKYDQKVGHTAVVYKQINGTLYIAEQNYPTGKGVSLRILNSSDYDNYTYVIQSDCLSK